MEFDSRGNDISIFIFSGGLSNCVLFLGIPREGIATKVDNEGSGRGKIILIASPVNVRVGSGD